MWNATTQKYGVRFGGGVYLRSSSGATNMGLLADTRNYEIAPSGGYRPILGYEPVDGQLLPSEAEFVVFSLENVVGTISPGDILTDGGSKEAIALTSISLVAPDNVTDGGDFLVDGDDYIVDGWTGGYVTVLITAGTWVATDELHVASKIADISVVSDPDIPVTDSDYITLKRLAISAQMNLIGAVPGSGPVRGVVKYNDVLYAWRDNAGATACAVYKSTATGWAAVSLGSVISFSTGTGEPEVGQTITGGTSGATGTVGLYVVTGGTAGSLTGKICITGITGTFQSGEVLTTTTSTVTSTSLAVANALLPGGAYKYRVNNFSGSTDTTAVYGCDGVNKAFEFNGTGFLPITTGLADDKPTDIEVHKNHLFLGYKSSVINSGIGTPHVWTALAGFFEFALGEDQVAMLPVAGALVVWTTGKTKVIYGSSAADWELATHADSAGADSKTVQPFGTTPLYLYQNRFVTLSTTSSFGDFKANSVSGNIDPLLDKIDTTAVASCVISSKNQYRLFLSSGLVIVGSMGAKSIEWMFHEYAHTVSCCSPYDTDMYFGSDDGFVYKMDSGTTFAGEPIPYFMRVLFSNFGSPGRRKLLRGIELDLDDFGGHNLDIKILIEAGKYRQYAPQVMTSSIISQSGDGYWNSSLWNVFTWHGNNNANPKARVKAIGTEFSFTLFSDAELEDSQRYVLAGAIIEYNNRGVQR